MKCPAMEVWIFKNHAINLVSSQTCISASVLDRRPWRSPTGACRLGSSNASSKANLESVTFLCPRLISVNSIVPYSL
ncbi:hypothetical protein BDV36DRAFT_252826, partial [Aspergillus pseudocaelatus]